MSKGYAFRWDGWLEPRHIRENRHTIFVFGDNMIRKGRGGLAKVRRKEPNTFGIATKMAPTSRPEDYFSEDFLVGAVKMWNADFQQLQGCIDKGLNVAFPEQPLGCGLARLPKKAPTLFSTLIRMTEDFIEKNKKI